MHFRFRQSFFSTLLWCAHLAIAPLAVSAAEAEKQTAQFGGVDRALSRLEQKVFGMENSEQPVATRLEILENKVFNRTQDGSLIERIGNLNEKTGAQTAQSTTAAQVKRSPTNPHTVMKGTVYDSEAARFGINATEETRPDGSKRIVIKSITPLSAGEIWGLAPGDEIIGVHANPSSTVVTISRDGKVYSAELSATRETIYTTRGSIGR